MAGEFGGYTVATVYTIRDELTPFLKLAAQLTRENTLVTDAYTAAMREQNVAARELGKSLSFLASEYRKVGVGVDLASRSVNTMGAAMENAGRSATSSAADFSAATSGIAAATDRAAAQVTMSTALMARGFAVAAESANGAFGAARRLNGAGIGSSSVLRTQIAAASVPSMLALGQNPLLSGARPATTGTAYRMNPAFSPMATAALAPASGGGRSGPPGWPRGTSVWAGGYPGGGWGGVGGGGSPGGPGVPGGPVSPGGGSGGGRSRGFGGLGAFAFGGIPHVLGHGAMLAADFAGGALIDSVYEAGKLQTNMLGIKNSTGASNAQLRALQQSIFNTADLTGASAVQMSQEYVTAARASGGVFRNKNGTFDMASFRDIVGDVAKAAEIQHITRGTDRADSVRTQMESVHLFRDFKGPELRHMLDLNTRLSEVMPNSQREALKQFTYFEPTFKAMGISDDDSVATLAAFSRAGYGTGKGGTNTQDLIQAALPALEMTKHAQEGKKALLERYGFLDSSGKSPYFNNNKADLTGFIGHLGQLHNQYGRDDLIVAFKSIFGQQGSRMANVFSDPKILEQLVGIKAILHDPKLSLNEQFKGYQGNFAFQAGRAGNAFQSLMTEVGGQALPGFTKGLRDLGDTLHTAQVWLHAHGSLEMKVQRDITNAVKGTEEWIVSHKQTWKNLETDLSLVYKTAVLLAPQLKTVGDGLAVIVDDASWFAQHFHPSNLGSDTGEFTTTGGAGYVDPNRVTGAQLGGAPLGLRLPVTPKGPKSFSDQYGLPLMPHMADPNAGVKARVTSGRTSRSHLTRTRDVVTTIEVGGIHIKVDGHKSPAEIEAAVRKALHSVIKMTGQESANGSSPQGDGTYKRMGMNRATNAH